jgi:hypothetical protein
VSDVHLTTRFEVNPRSLPAVETGDNLFHFSTMSAIERVEVPARSLQATTTYLHVNTERGQSLSYPEISRNGSAVYTLEDGARDLTGFEVGVRFLDMRDGRAPNKLTAEVRDSKIRTHAGPASLAWSTSRNGPYRELWTYTDQPQWLDGQPISRLLRWPEVFREVRTLPPGTKRVYIRIDTGGPAFDNVRFALYRQGNPASGQIAIVQKWHEGAAAREHTEAFAAPTKGRDFSIHAGSSVRNGSIMFTCR